MEEHNHQHHNHNHEINSVNRAFVIGIVLNSIFVVVEIIAGFASKSMSLLTDAGHNLSDVASLALSLLAFKMVDVVSTSTYTYGYKKSTILVALLNALILLLAVVFIAYEAISRFFSPVEMQGKTMILIAGIGIVINAFTAYLFMKDKEDDINVKGAYLHLAADALVSFGVVVGGIIILYTNWFWIDSLLSLIIAGVILYSTWSLLVESLRLALDGVPKNINLDNLRSEVLKVKGVIDFHHIHVWAIGSKNNALTAHMVLNEKNQEKIDVIKNEVKHVLEHLAIHHSTIEVHGEKTCEEGQEC